MTVSLLSFALACAASVIVALLLAVLLRHAAVRLPALFVHRSVWLLAQCAVLAAVVLACVPLPRSDAAPVLLLPSIAAPRPAPAAAPASPIMTAAPSEPDPSSLVERALAWLPAAWALLYLAGFAWHAGRRLTAHCRWNKVLLAHSHIVTAAQLIVLHPDQYALITRTRLRVRTTDLPVSPMLLGAWRSCLLLPAHLRTLPAQQQDLIVAHELAHYRRADPLWLLVSTALALVFWFNRPFQRLHAGLREAVELGCDDTVLAGRPSNERRSYAAALLAQLRLQLPATMTSAAPAFGNLGVAGRMQRMQTIRASRLSWPARVVSATGMFALAAGSAALQPQFAAAEVELPEPPPAPAPAPANVWRYPLDQVRVTSLYGVRSKIVPAGHHGVDFAARRGTPVHAVAGGTVTHAAFHPTWGHYVRVDHGGGVSSQLIHLDRIGVASGQRVQSGDVIGDSGASGAATGPHLHLEYWHHGRRLDPEIMLADLSTHATPRALARRSAQGNPIPTDQ